MLTCVILHRLLRGVATIIREPGGPAAPELLRLIAWLPGRQVHPAAMQTALFAWFWLLAAVPSVTVRRLHDMCSSSYGTYC